MALEIERKFLTLSDDWRQQSSHSEDMIQGYLGNTEKLSMRVRITGECALLNIKTRSIGSSRHEYEYEIPLADGRELLESRQGPCIEKTRYYVPVGKHTWEIDVFTGDNAGLVVAEIELQHNEESFDKPAWLGPEVTDDERYYNAALARHPFSLW